MFCLYNILSETPSLSFAQKLLPNVHHLHYISARKESPYFREAKIGASMSFFLKIAKSWMHFSSNTELISLFRILHMGLAILEKSLMNLHQKPAWSIKFRTPFMEIGGGSFSITSTLTRSISNGFFETSWMNNISSFTIKWHFSQFRIRLVSSYLATTLSKFPNNLSKHAQKLRSN